MLTLTLSAMAIATIAASIVSSWSFYRLARDVRAELAEIDCERTTERQANDAQARNDAATIYRLTVALDDARRLLDDPRARGKQANRTAWELERQAWLEATR